MTTNPELTKAISTYPDVVRNLISFITDPMCLNLLSVGGQYKGEITFRIAEGKVTAMIPAMEVKAGKEVSLQH